MPMVTVQDGPFNGGVGVYLFDVVDSGGSTGTLASSKKLVVGSKVDAHPLPKQLQNTEFNGHRVDYMDE